MGPWACAALLAFLLLDGRARAGDVRLVLTDGRAIVGDLVESDSLSYVVETSRGEVTVRRSDVRRLEGLVSGRPETPRAALPASTRSAVLGSTASAPVTPPRAAPGSARMPPAAGPGREAELVAAARDWLARADGVSEGERRSRLVEAIARFGHRALVAIVGDPGWDPGRHADRLAREALLLSGGAARDDLVRATVDGRARAAGVLALLEPIFDDTVEVALDRLLPTLDAEEQVGVAHVLERCGTARSAALLGKLVLATTDAADGALPEALGAALAGIAGRQRSPAALIRAALPDVRPGELPGGFSIRGLLRALRAAPLDRLHDLLSIADVVELEQVSPDPSVRVFARYRLTWLYEALAASGAPAGVARVLRAIDHEQDPELRLAWLRGLSAATSAATNKELIGRLLSGVRDGGAEGEAALDVLGALTGKWFGRNFEAWEAYRRGCTSRGSSGPR